MTDASCNPGWKQNWCKLIMKSTEHCQAMQESNNANRAINISTKLLLGKALFASCARFCWFEERAQNPRGSSSLQIFLSWSRAKLSRLPRDAKRDRVWHGLTIYNMLEGCGKNAQPIPARLVTCMQYSLPSCTLSPFPTAVWFNIFAKASPFGKPKAHMYWNLPFCPKLGWILILIICT